MKEKTKKNWQVVALFLFAALIAILFAALFYLNNQIEQNNRLLIKLTSQNIAWQKDLTKIVSWQKNTIQQYVDTANLVLSSGQDIKSAILLLDTAKKYTDNLLDNNIIASLDKNINLLKAINSVNSEELIAKIDIIGQGLNNLAIIPNTALISPTKINTPNNIATQAKYPEVIRKFLDGLLKSLKDIVIIRRGVLEPIVFAEQEVALRFNLGAKIMQLQLAVLQKHDAIYHNCLTQVANLIKKYFICSSSEKNQLLKEIDELQKINLQPQLPKIILEIKS